MPALECRRVVLAAQMRGNHVLQNGSHPAAPKHRGVLIVQYARGARPRVLEVVR